MHVLQFLKSFIRLCLIFPDIFDDFPQVDALRLRLEEKESFLNKKTKQLQDVTDEKGTLTGEIRDLKDMLAVKERKIIVLQKKVSAKMCALNTSEREAYLLMKSK